MTGTIVQISISRGGIPKYAVPNAVLTPLGLEGDAHANSTIHGGPRQAVLLMTAETIAELTGRGYPVFHGAMGENLTVAGMDETEICPRPCSAQDIYGVELKREVYDSLVKAGDPESPRWAMSGFYAAVISPGVVRVDDEIALESELA